MTSERRRVLVELLLVETAAVLAIAFVFFVWPYPPFVWKPNYEILNGTNPITVSVAAIAWVGVGYVAFAAFRWLRALTARFGSRAAG